MWAKCRTFEKTKTCVLPVLAARADQRTRVGWRPTAACPSSRGSRRRRFFTTNATYADTVARRKYLVDPDRRRPRRDAQGWRHPANRQRCRGSCDGPASPRQFWGGRQKRNKDATGPVRPGMEFYGEGIGDWWWWVRPAGGLIPHHAHRRGAQGVSPSAPSMSLLLVNLLEWSRRGQTVERRVDLIVEGGRRAGGKLG